MICKVNYDLTFPDMIDACRLDWMSRGLKERKISMKGCGIVKFEPALFGLKVRGLIKPKDVLEEMESEKFIPSKNEHLLAFGACLPERQRENPIIALDGFIRAGGAKHYLYLGADGAGRYADLWFCGAAFNSSCRFLGIRLL